MTPSQLLCDVIAQARHTIDSAASLTAPHR